MFSVLRCGAFLLLISTFLGLYTADRNNQRASSPDRSHLSLSPNTSDLKRSLSPDTSDLKRSLSPGTSDLKRSLSPDTSDLKRSLSPDTSDLERSLSPDTSDLERSLSPDTSNLKRSLSPDTSDLERSLSPDTSDLKRSLSPDTSDLKRSLSPDTSNLKRSLSPDRSHLKRSPYPDPSQPSFSRDSKRSVRSPSSPLSSLLFRGSRTAESSQDSAVENAQGEAEQHAEEPDSQGRRQKRDHLEEEDEAITLDKLTKEMHDQTMSLMNLEEKIKDLDKKADDVMEKPSEDDSDVKVEARVKAMMDNLKTMRDHIQEMQGNHLKRELPEQPAVLRHAQGREPATVGESHKTARDLAKQEDPLQQQVNQLQLQVRELQELMTALLQQTESLRNLREIRTSS